MSHSSLERVWSHSLAKYWDRCYLNPDAEPDEPNKYMVLGRAAHWLFLGEREFLKHFVRRPVEWAGYAWNGNRTEHRAWLKEQEKLGLTVLTPDQVDAIVGMGRSLSKHPMVQAGLLRGRVECSMVVEDEETGLWIKTRPDVIPVDNDFVDLKIVSDISEEGLERAIGERGLHRQMALVCETAAYLSGNPLIFRSPGEGAGFSATLVFVEAVRPYSIEVVTLKPDNLRRGVAENRELIRLVAMAARNGDWPGPTGHQRDARYLGMTSWQEKKDEYRLKQVRYQRAAMVKEAKDG